MESVERLSIKEINQLTKQKQFSKVRTVTSQNESNTESNRLKWEAFCNFTDVSKGLQQFELVRQLNSK